VIVSEFFIAVILFSIIQSSGNEKNDAHEHYAGPHLIGPTEVGIMSGEFSQIMSDDYDGDGKKHIDVVAMPSFTDEQIKAALGEDFTVADELLYSPYTVANTEQSFSQQVFAGDSSLLLLDEYWYRMLRSNGTLEKLSEVLDSVPSCLADEYSIYLGDTEFAGFFDNASKLPKDTRICFCVLSTASAFTGRKNAERLYENSKKLLNDLLSFGSN
ncbi:MAG: hypothetical protein KBT31_05345, partial [Firmicutes bacterium]|nr:hypothetical protein [Candidatus Colimorpha enterica]